MKKNGQRRGWAAAFVLTSALLILPGCVSIEFFESSRGDLVETRVSGPKIAPKILLLDIRGEIRETEEGGGLFGRSSEGSAARVREELDRARTDSQVKALLLRIDSPGGSATASDVAYHEILRFKQETNLPILAQIMGMAASGGYYVAMASDEIRAHPTSITGSIGVIYTGVSVAGLMEKLGIYDQTLTSGPYKSAGSPLQRMTPEQRTQLQSIIDELHARFVSIVDRGRPGLELAQVKKLADGRIYSANQALEAGLVDGLGSIDDAVVRLQELAGLDRAQVVSYHRSSEYRKNLYTKAPGTAAPRLDLQSLLGIPPARPGFHYLWLPPSF
jgi:protease-4